MSSDLTRQAVRAAVATWSATESVIFHDTVNAEISRPTVKWSTVEFLAASSEPLDFAGVNWIERTTAAIVVYTKAGTGGDEAARLATSAQLYFSGLAVLANGVNVISVEPPEETDDSGRSRGGWYGLAISLDLERYFQGG